MSQKQKNDKIVEFQVLNQEVKNLHEKMESINNSVQEMHILGNTLKELRDIRESQEILVPLGQGIFAKGNIKNTDDLIVNVGSNIFLDKSIQETGDMVRLNMLNLSRLSENVEEEINRNIGKLQELQKEIAERGKQ